MSIYALHDAESWNRLHTYVQQKVIQYTLLAVSTLTQKQAEEAKLRVHDHPLKTTAKATSDLHEASPHQR
jgi:hypothetical protein